MLKKIGLLSLILFVVFSATSANAAWRLFHLNVQQNPYNNMVFWRQFSPAPFNQIRLSGPMEVQINGGSNTSTVQIAASWAMQSKIQIVRSNGVLIISVPPGCLEIPKVVISLAQLNRLEANGKEDISGNNLTGELCIAAQSNNNILLSGCNIDLRRIYIIGSSSLLVNGVNSRQLNVYDRTSGNVQLNGFANLQRLDDGNSGTFALQWVNGCDVQVIAQGTGHIFLAGATDVFEAYLYGSYYLDAKFLTAKHVFVDTNQNSNAEVRPGQSLTASAKNCSNVYYYHKPILLSPYALPPASILNMCENTQCVHGVSNWCCGNYPNAF